MKTRAPQRLPPHQNIQSNIITLGTPSSTASANDVCPTRARAPMLTIEAVAPRTSSSRAGCEELSSGNSGSSTRP
jgi:hypothetical protein